MLVDDVYLPAFSAKLPLVFYIMCLIGCGIEGSEKNPFCITEICLVIHDADGSGASMSGLRSVL